MTLPRVLFHSSIFIYAVGADHPLQSPCRRLFEGLLARQVAAEASVLAVQEVLHQRARRTRDRESAARFARDLTAACPVHEVTPADLALALQLYGDSARLDAADALHAATALGRDIRVIVTPDRAFDDVAGLTRLDPATAAGLLAS